MTTGFSFYTLVRPDLDRELDQLLRLQDERATELLLVRHGKPDPTPDGWPLDDPPLGAEGIIQSHKLARRFSSSWVEAVYTAPEARCAQTARVLAGVLERPLEEVADLRDVAFEPLLAEVASWGCLRPSLSRLFGENPRWDALPGFEMTYDFRRRSVQAMESIIEKHLGERIVVVTHASVINAYLSALLEIPRDLFFVPEHASISTVRSLEEVSAVRGLNDTSHLARRSACE